MSQSKVHICASCGTDSNEIELLRRHIEQLENTCKELEENVRVAQVELELLGRKNAQLLHESEDLRDLARVDELTGVGNRRAFNEVLENEIARAVRNDDPLTIVALDIDHFKTINDTCGHHFGDVMIRTLAQILIVNIRAFDKAFRWGGDEFFLVMPNTTIEEAKELIERLRALVERNLKVVLSSSKKFVMATTSFGVAQLHGNEVPHRLFRRADAALYDAKGRGRNQVAVRTSEDDHEL